MEISRFTCMSMSYPKHRLIQIDLPNIPLSFIKTAFWVIVEHVKTIKVTKYGDPPPYGANYICNQILKWVRGIHNIG